MIEPIDPSSARAPSRRPSRGGVSLLLFATLAATAAHAEISKDRLGELATEIEERVIEWRRDIHRHPELGNREVRTAALVEQHLRRLGLEVETEVAHTGVVGLLEGDLPGPVVALRADMDALPVKELADVPFASREIGEYNGEKVPVMHACGHDNHVAILMGVAEVLAAERKSLEGTVKFIFQPAEEGPPAGEDGGASMMIAEGVLEDPRPSAIFALHVGPTEGGTLRYREGGTMAASDELHILVEGRQTHGSSPWMGVDPVIVSAQIMTALQTIPSRQMDVTRAPSVVTIGKIEGGVRGNIIPSEVEMTGTIRTFDTAMRADLLERIERTATRVAESAGATATVTIRPYAPVTFNDRQLTRDMVPSLEWAAGGSDKVSESLPVMGAEDFAFFQERIPGFYFHLGVNRPGVAAGQAAPNHSPYFYADESALVVGVRALAAVAVDYLQEVGR